MGPKKQPKNGYYFLMRDHKIQEEKRGRYMSMAQAADEVKDIWARMNTEERSYFNRMAEEYKRNKSEEKYNTCGMAFSELERIQLEKEREISMMNEVIRDTIKHLNKETTLRTNIFHVIHVNYYCETDRHKFIPAEIAIAKFNLEEGVKDTFHRFVSPSNDGTLPLGYRYIANEHINNTHKTPIEWDRGERDLNKLFNDIRTFVKPEGTTGELPPLYTMPDNQNTNCSESAVKGALRQLCENQNLDSDLFRVYRLPKLFHELRNACNPVFVSPSIAETELEKDVFIYTRGIACTFHEEEDVMQFCSLSTVQRWIYLMCDHCCADLDIELQPGFHCPVKSNIRRKQGSGWSSDQNKSSSRRESPPRQVEIKPYTIIAPGAMSLEAQANRSAGCGDAGSDDRGYVGYNDTKSERSVPKNCWSSVADRTNSSAHLPPSFDENNYPSIGVGRTGSDSSGGSRHNAWSGRGRGSRGRGLTSNFAQLNFNN